MNREKWRTKTRSVYSAHACENVKAERHGVKKKSSGSDLLIEINNLNDFSVASVVQISIIFQHLKLPTFLIQCFELEICFANLFQTRWKCERFVFSSQMKSEQTLI